MNGFDDDSAAPAHGGDLAQAIVRYTIPAADWLDLSAAMNPAPYTPPPIPAEYFQRLPADVSALLAAAHAYYIHPHAAAESARTPHQNDAGAAIAVVAAAGSQQAIQWLPLLRPRCRVAVPRCGYSEHAYRWRRAGHELFEYDARDDAAVETLLARERIDVLIVINPHNPLGLSVPASRLLHWLELLQRRGGWLVVDEAFIDPDPRHSLAAHAGRPGLIVLRSLGKFFGLAGLRCGFVLCESALAERLRTALGPWPLSGPAVFVATCALRDTHWQDSARAQLRATASACSTALRTVFADCNADIHSTHLFVGAILAQAPAQLAHEKLARAGIWIRWVALDDGLALLRFGLVTPGGAEWRRFQRALDELGAELSAAAQPFSIT